MIAVVAPGALRGRVRIPASKSCAHRLLIAAALADAPTLVRLDGDSADIAATIGCLTALGAVFARRPEGYLVTPRRETADGQTLFCGESGSTLRFLLPVTAALGVPARFTGVGRLPERPNAPLLDALRAHGVQASGELLPLSLRGRLRGGEYAIAGNVSSQYITGLLLALPLCPQDSVVTLTTRLESASYVEVTAACLRAFSIRIERTETGYRIPGGQRYHSPGESIVEGDWSSAAFYLAANALGGEVTCEGLDPASPQGDRAMTRLVGMLGGAIDVTDTPDLVPALAVAAATHAGVTRLTGAARLRLKESDRLLAVCRLLTALGGDCRETEDGLLIRGVEALHGGEVDGCNDHRIVMAAAVAATAARGAVRVTDAQAVAKSYPAFFEHFRALGGNVHVEPDR